MHTFTFNVVVYEAVVQQFSMYIEAATFEEAVATMRQKMSNYDCSYMFNCYAWN
jgi:hypothetical protein